MGKYEGNDWRTSEMMHSIQSLSSRELEVLQKVIEGRTTKEIARTFSLSPRTVEIYRNRILLKVHARTFTEAVRLLADAALLGLLPRIDGSVSDQFLSPLQATISMAAEGVDTRKAE